MQNWCIPCEIVRDRSAAWLDDELSPAETDVIAEHLEKCKECSTLYEQLSLIDIKPPKLRVVANDNYWAAMDRELSKAMDDAGTPRKQVFPAWQVIALAACLILSIFWGYQQNMQVVELEQVIHNQQKDIERMQRISAQPVTPRINPYVVPANLKKSKHVPIVFDM